MILAKSKVQVSKIGQYVITIPKQFAEAMGLSQGQELEWKVAGAGRLELVKPK